jgi:hypothetical protein
MIAQIVKPYSFINLTKAESAKVNANFDVAIAAVNEVITALNAASGTKTSLTIRLAAALNDDGSIKATALPVGTYDPRRTRTISAAASMATDDSVVLVDTTDGDVVFTLLSAAATNISPTIINIGLTGYKVVITPAGAETIMALATYELTVGGEPVRISPDGAANWWRSG